MCCHSLFGVQRTDDPPAATPVLLLETGNTSQAHDITADRHHWSSQTRWYLQHGSVCLLRCELRPPHWFLKSGRTRHRFIYARSFPRWVFFQDVVRCVHGKFGSGKIKKKLRLLLHHFYCCRIGSKSSPWYRPLYSSMVASPVPNPHKDICSSESRAQTDPCC